MQVGTVHWWPAPVSVGGLLVGVCCFISLWLGGEYFFGWLRGPLVVGEIFYGILVYVFHDNFFTSLLGILRFSRDDDDGVGFCWIFLLW